MDNINFMSLRAYSKIIPNVAEKVSKEKNTSIV